MLSFPCINLIILSHISVSSRITESHRVSIPPTTLPLLVWETNSNGFMSWKVFHQFPQTGRGCFPGFPYPWHILMAQHLSQRIAILLLPVCHSQEAWAPLNPLPLCSLASSPVSQQTSEQIKRRCVSVAATCVNSEDVSLFARSLLALWLGQPSRNFLACSTGTKWFSRHVVTWSVQFCGMKETLDCQREQALPERRIEVSGRPFTGP